MYSPICEGSPWLPAENPSCGDTPALPGPAGPCCGPGPGAGTGLPQCPGGEQSLLQGIVSWRASAANPDTSSRTSTSNTGSVPQCWPSHCLAHGKELSNSFPDTPIKLYHHQDYGPQHYKNWGWLFNEKYWTLTDTFSRVFLLGCWKIKATLQPTIKRRNQPTETNPRLYFMQLATVLDRRQAHTQVEQVVISNTPSSRENGRPTPVTGVGNFSCGRMWGTHSWAVCLPAHSEQSSVPGTLTQKGQVSS